jgi:effector-binding domain-containing protein
MQTEPHIVERPERAYVGITRRVTMQTVAEIADRLPGIFASVNQRGIVPAGPPFFRYLAIDTDGGLEIEVGVPVPANTAGEGDVVAGVLPGGRYAVVRHHGPPDQLLGATAGLLDWAKERGLEWDVTPGPAGDRWGCRLEEYLTDPREQPDPNRWETDLAFRLAD